jgi:hypothetical protein
MNRIDELIAKILRARVAIQNQDYGLAWNELYLPKEVEDSLALSSPLEEGKELPSDEEIQDAALAHYPREEWWTTNAREHFVHGAKWLRSRANSGEGK